jgi:hypothetical protein
LIAGMLFAGLGGAIAAENESISRKNAERFCDSDMQSI